MSDGDGLRRELGLFEATSIGLGTMIGGGIFILPSIAAAQAGPASMVSFAVGGLVSLLAAVSHAELATAMQDKSGGGYEYVDDAFGALAGSVVGWGMWVGLVFASAFYLVGFGRYLTFFHDPLPVVGAAAVAAVFLTAVNFYGAAKAGKLQDVIVVVLLVLIFVFVAFGVFSVNMGEFSPFAPEGWGSVATTIGTVYVALIGFGVVATVAEEVENPARNLPLAMGIAVVLPTVLYVLVMFVSVGVLPADRLSDSRIPVADVARQYLGQLGALAMVVGAVLATVSSANASILSAGRVSFSMGDDRVLTDWFRKTHSRFGTPYRAVLVTGGGILALVLLQVELETLAEVGGFLFLVAYGFVHLAVIRFRRSVEDYNPEFWIPDVFYPWIPIVGVLFALAIMTQMRLVVVGGGLAVIFAGVAWYLVYVR